MKSNSFSLSRLTSLATAGVVAGVVAACGFIPTENDYRRRPRVDDVDEPIPVGEAPETTTRGDSPPKAEAEPPELGLFAEPINDPFFGGLVNTADDEQIESYHASLFGALRSLIGTHSRAVAEAHRVLELLVADGLRRGEFDDGAIEDAVRSLIDASVDDVASQLEILEAFHSLLSRKERERIAHAVFERLKRDGAFDRDRDESDASDESDSDSDEDANAGDDGDDGQNDDGDDGQNDDGDEEPPPWVGFPWPPFPLPHFPIPSFPDGSPSAEPGTKFRRNADTGDASLTVVGPDTRDGASARPHPKSPMVLLRRAGVHPRHDQVLELRRVARSLRRQVEKDAMRTQAVEREYLIDTLAAFASDHFSPDIADAERRIEERVRREVRRHLTWIRTLLDVLTLEQRAVLARFIEEHAGALVGDARPQHPGRPVVVSEPTEPR